MLMIPIDTGNKAIKTEILSFILGLRHWRACRGKMKRR